MNRMIPRYRTLLSLALFAWVVGTSFAVIGYAPSATAADESEEQSEKELLAEQEAAAARARTMKPRIARYLVKARELLLAGEYEEAEKILLRLNPRRLSAYERALTSSTLAYAAFGQGKLDVAVSKLQEALDEKVLSATVSADLLFQIAQIHAAEENWAAVVETLTTWFEVAPNPGADAYFFLGNAYFRLDDFESAVVPARKAIEIAEYPKQPHHQLRLAVELSRKDYPAATTALVDLLSNFPELGVQYWLQLSSLYGIQGEIPRALAVLEIAHRKGLIVEDRPLRRLAQLAQSEGLPLRSAYLLESGLESDQIKRDVTAYEMLGNSWILARSPDRALPALKIAADESPDGDLYVRLAQVMISNEQWLDATGALKSALAKGGLDDPSSADLLLGIAYYNADRLSEARDWFNRARRAEKTRASADAWLEHLDNEANSEPGGETTVG